MTQFDKNANNALEAAEIEASPALKAALGDMDTDANGQLTKAEIVGGLELFSASRVGLINPSCVVQLNGKPLAGAIVRLIPERFLGELIEPAEGVTDETGTAVPSVPASSLPNDRMRGIRLGFYRVEISRPSNGNESVPVRYNTQSTLGLFVPPDSPDTFRFDLSG